MPVTPDDQPSHAERLQLVIRFIIERCTQQMKNDGTYDPDVASAWQLATSVIAYLDGGRLPDASIMLTELGGALVDADVAGVGVVELPAPTPESVDLVRRALTVTTPKGRQISLLSVRGIWNALSYGSVEEWAAAKDAAEEFVISIPHNAEGVSRWYCVRCLKVEPDGWPEDFCPDCGGNLERSRLPSEERIAEMDPEKAEKARERVRTAVRE